MACLSCDLDPGFQEENMNPFFHFFWKQLYNFHAPGLIHATTTCTFRHTAIWIATNKLIIFQQVKLIRS